jgi:hypothetical protein
MSTAVRHRVVPLAGALVAVAGVLAGCANASEDDVRAVAAVFAAGGPQQRCDLLAAATLTALDADGQPCAAAIAALPLGSGAVSSVQVWGADALVHLSDDTLFLTLAGTGWRVSAGACTPAVEGPYQCRMEGT